MCFSARKQCSRFWNLSSDEAQFIKDRRGNLKAPLFDYLYFWLPLGGHRMMSPSGKLCGGEGKAAISEIFTQPLSQKTRHLPFFI
jgi:hypothetical protein